MRKKLLFVAVILAAGVILLLWQLPRIDREFLYPKEYTEYVKKYSREYGVDENIIYAIIKTESGFNPDAESEAGARGLMQLMEDAFDWSVYRMGGEEHAEYSDLFDAEYNIKYGTFLFSLLYKEYADYPTALAAYHSGRGNVNKWLMETANSSNGLKLDRNIPSRATAHYVDKVMTSFDKYVKLYN
ncbi:MAG: lytic transglycosylase domain-containing protein [Ruminococcus sp.]|jgi:soluble lytic murein transglycosylase|nr:lytic transglycosylase domain-containing protein [Ruminococcus sp.]